MYYEIFDSFRLGLFDKSVEYESYGYCSEINAQVVVITLYKFLNGDIKLSRAVCPHCKISQPKLRWLDRYKYLQNRHEHLLS